VNQVAATSISEPDALRGGSRDAGLAVGSISVGYGGANVLFDVSLAVAGGSVTALLGPNGAGKSTLGRAISGLVPLQQGEIWFDGAKISGLPAHRIRSAGLAYIPEGRGIFPGLDVSDNLRMAVRAIPSSRRVEALDEVFSTFPILGQRRHQRAGSLSGGEQQMLALARVLSTSPRLIIADEMSLGLAPKVVDIVLEGIERARTTGITIVLVEQFVHRALAIADNCVIISRGQVSWHGAAADAQAEVLHHYLGRH
jgi:branched-chain amino acid transport system ATP-binding protein